MKCTLPILLALTLLLAAITFAQAQAASIPGGVASTSNSFTAALTSTITTTSVLTRTDLNGVIVPGPGTADLPEALTVTLYAYQPGAASMDLVLSTTTTARPDGQFIFEDVPQPDGSVFLASTTYAGVPYHSAPSLGEPVTITVFDVTTTTEHLMADQLHLIFDFPEGGDMLVMEVYILTNVGTRTIVPGSQDGLMLDFPLPEGAQEPDYRSGLVGEAELFTNDGYWETQAVRPGGMYGVSYAFSFPYDGSLTLSQPIALSVSSVGAMLPALGTLKVESANLADGGLSDFGGISYRIYTGESLRKGDQLAVKISGSSTGSASQAATSRSRLGLIVGLGAFGLVLVLAGVWLSRRSRMAAMENEAETEAGDEPGLEEEDETESAADPEALMDDIIALDDLYQAGELPEAAYRERRAELKEKLRAVVGDHDRSP